MTESTDKGILNNSEEDHNIKVRRRIIDWCDWLISKDLCYDTKQKIWELRNAANEKQKWEDFLSE